MKLDTDFTNRAIKVWRVPDFVLEYALEKHDLLDDRSKFIISVCFAKYVGIIHAIELEPEEITTEAMKEEVISKHFPSFVRLTYCLSE